MTTLGRNKTLTHTLARNPRTIHERMAAPSQKYHGLIRRTEGITKPSTVVPPKMDHRYTLEVHTRAWQTGA